MVDGNGGSFLQGRDWENWFGLASTGLDLDEASAAPGTRHQLVAEYDLWQLGLRNIQDLQNLTEISLDFSHEQLGF